MESYKFIFIHSASIRHNHLFRLHKFPNQAHAQKIKPGGDARPIQIDFVAVVIEFLLNDFTLQVYDG